MLSAVMTSLQFDWIFIFTLNSVAALVLMTGMESKSWSRRSSLLVIGTFLSFLHLITSSFSEFGAGVWADEVGWLMIVIGVVLSALILSIRPFLNSLNDTLILWTFGLFCVLTACEWWLVAGCVFWLTCIISMARSIWFPASLRSTTFNLHIECRHIDTLQRIQEIISVFQIHVESRDVQAKGRIMCHISYQTSLILHHFFLKKLLVVPGIRSVHVTS